MGGWGGVGGMHKNIFSVCGRISLGCKVGLEDCEHSVAVMIQDFKGWTNVLCVTPLLPRQEKKRIREAPLVCDKAMGYFEPFYLKT